MSCKEDQRPRKMVPVLRERIWGGSRLLKYNKEFEGCSMGESWETYSSDGSIPVLIKFIDANDVLSVQVHPSDDYARRTEGQKNGKTEAWIVLDCDEDAHIVYGFTRKTGREELEALLRENRLSELLNFVKVKKGDCIFIPSGTIHTMGKGLMVYEIQQNSDITYRLYDWDRVDKSGNRRELHIEKALDVIDYSNSLHSIQNIYDLYSDIPESAEAPNAHMGNTAIDLFENIYFSTKYLYTNNRKIWVKKSGVLQIVSIISGSAYIGFEKEKIHMKKGETLLIPQGWQGEMHLESLETVEYIETTYPGICGQ